MTEIDHARELLAVLQKLQGGISADLEPVLQSAVDHAQAVIEESERREVQLQESNQARAKFVSVVTHELRIPMTSIKGYTDLLRAGVVGPINEQQASFLNTIRSNVERMSALVSDLSDLSHIESGRMKLTTSSFSLSGTIDNLMLSFGPRFEEKKQNFTLDLPADLPQVVADTARTSQVIAALLNNAHKYTPEEGNISLRAVEEADCVRVEVSDSGAGIATDDQPRIFEAFFRSEDPLVREQPGWGLNLNLAHKLMELMNGSIGFSSEHKKGSTFWITLPRAN